MHTLAPLVNGKEFRAIPASNAGNKIISKMGSTDVFHPEMRFFFPCTSPIYEAKLDFGEGWENYVQD